MTINLFRVLGLALAAGALASCSQASFQKAFNYGAEARVTCYSGDMTTFDDFSSGRVEDSEHSDGYYFVARSTKRLVHVSGPCVIDYGAGQTADFKPVLIAPRR